MKKEKMIKIIAKPMKLLITDIEYEKDGQNVELPESLTLAIPDTLLEDLVVFTGNYISDKTGFLHHGFKMCIYEEHEFFLGNNLSSLPLFGGKEPLNTEGLGSWDEESFLVYEEEEWKIQPRSDFDWVKYE